jgi:DUF4097 and DUF4098 domain-containing protein YvlB
MGVLIFDVPFDPKNTFTKVIFTMKEKEKMFKKVLITSITLLAVLIVAQVANLRTSNAQVNTWRYTDHVQPDELSYLAESGDELREEFHQTYPTSANGRVSLENLNGAVHIKVWDRNEVRVDAVKRAYKRERLNEARIEVSATADVIRISTRYPDHDQSFNDDERGRYNNPALVEYSITVPRKNRLESIDLVNGSLDVDGVEGDVRASSVNGRLTARGLMGEAKLSTINGSLEAVFTRLDESKQVSLGSVNGGLLLIIPSDVNALVKASTVHGVISNDFGLEVQHGEYVGHDLYGQLGSGGSRIKLGNVNGQIVIKHAQDGRKLSSATCLLPQKDKDKEKDKAKGLNDEDLRDLSEQARRTAEQALANVDTARITREAQAEAQREVERAMREAQREIQRAQLEVQRETRQQIREQVRNRGEGAGKGKGEGTGGRRVTERESKSFTVAGKARVNVVTYDGAVTVRGWDKSEVMYSVTKQGGDEQEVKTITIQADQQGSVVSIIAKSGEAEGSASLDVYVPRNASLHVSSDDGALTLQGVSGDLTLRTGDGSIEVTDGHGQLQANTGDGHIRITNFEGQVDARTGDGSITLDGNFTGLAARTGDGSISLSVPADANFTIETNTDSISNEGLTVSEDMAPSKRVKRWKVGRGGNLFVLSTGDGSIVIRPH